MCRTKLVNPKNDFNWDLDFGFFQMYRGVYAQMFDTGYH